MLRVLSSTMFLWFVLEIMLWILFAQYTSGWYLFFWFILAFMIGSNMIRRAFVTLSPVAQQMKQQSMTSPVGVTQGSMLKSIALAIAGFMLMVPGVMSDVIALLILLPPMQNLFKGAGEKYVRNNQDKVFGMMSGNMGKGGFSAFGGFSAGQNPFGSANQQTFEGSARTTSVNDEDVVVVDAKDVTVIDDSPAPKNFKDVN